MKYHWLQSNLVDFLEKNKDSEWAYKLQITGENSKTHWINIDNDFIAILIHVCAVKVGEKNDKAVQ